MLNKTLWGLVVGLPDSSGTGVVLDATRQGKGLYKATIVCNNGDLLVAQFKTNSIRIGEDIEYIDYSFFSPRDIVKLL